MAAPIFAGLGAAKSAVAGLGAKGQAALAGIFGGSGGFLGGRLSGSDGIAGLSTVDMLVLLGAGVLVLVGYKEVNDGDG